MQFSVIGLTYLNSMGSSPICPLKAQQKGDDNMGKVLEKCKCILATQRKSDNESICRLIRETARELKVNVTETQMERAIVYLKYGCMVW